jgi:hydroxyethylthiazole kinase
MSNSASSFTGVSSGYTAGTPVPADSPIRDNIADAVRRVRETTPLAQSFTNFVTINLVANAQLAAGGTAAMSFLPDDVIETAKIAGANYINVGTLLPFYKDALPEIAQRLNYLDKPWVLDPVAASSSWPFTWYARSAFFSSA